MLDGLLVGIAMEILIARDCEGRGGRLRELLFFPFLLLLFLCLGVC